jgi:hypothetical protein
MSESPTDRELLLEILWRLGRIEDHLGILGYRSRIGDPNRPPVPRGEEGHVVPAKASDRGPVGSGIVPPPFLEPLLEQGGASEGES